MGGLALPLFLPGFLLLRRHLGLLLLGRIQRHDVVQPRVRGGGGGWFGDGDGGRGAGAGRGRRAPTGRPRALRRAVVELGQVHTRVVHALRGEQWLRLVRLHGTTEHKTTVGHLWGAAKAKAEVSKSFISFLLNA